MHVRKDKGRATDLHGLPAPLAVLGVLGEAPQVEVGLDRLGPKDVVLLVLPRGACLRRLVEAEAFGS